MVMNARDVVNSVFENAQPGTPGGMAFMPGILPPQGFYVFGMTFEEAIANFFESFQSVYSSEIGDIDLSDWQRAFTLLQTQFDLVFVYNDAGDIIVYNTNRDDKFPKAAQVSLLHHFGINRMTPVLWFDSLDGEMVEIDAGRAFYGRPTKPLPKGKKQEPETRSDKKQSMKDKLLNVRLSDEEKLELLGGKGDIDSLGT